MSWNPFHHRGEIDSAAADPVPAEPGAAKPAEVQTVPLADRIRAVLAA